MHHHHNLSNVGVAIKNHPFLMVGIQPIKMIKNGDEWGMVYGIAIPTLVWMLHLYMGNLFLLYLYSRHGDPIAGAL